MTIKIRTLKRVGFSGRSVGWLVGRSCACFNAKSVTYNFENDTRQQQQAEQRKAITTIQQRECHQSETRKRVQVFGPPYR